MMKKTLLAACAMVALATAPALAQSKSVKIGFVSTFSGPTAVIGNDMRNSFELALDHLGRKMGGLPVEVIYEDDQQKPEVGVQKTQKLPRNDQPMPIVLAGGTSKPNGFRDRFEKALRRRSWPFQIGEVRMASDPLTATARGALVAALAER